MEPEMHKQKSILLFLLLAFPLAAQHDIWQQIQTLEQQGKLKQAQGIIQDYLQNNPSLPQSEQTRLRFAGERLCRLPDAFPLSEADLLKQLESKIANFKKKELAQWEKEGRLDFILIEGQKRYQYASRSNLFFRYPEIRARRLNPPDDSGFEREMLAYCQKAKQSAEASLERYVLPQRFRATMSVRVDADIVPEGKTVRCWLPYPRAYPFQTDINLLVSDPPALWLDQPLSPIRSLYLERKAEAGKQVQFSCQFEYTSWATYAKVDPSKVIAVDYSKGELAEFTSERPPHVAFTPELRRLAQEIVGQEQNPYRKARRVYDWIAENIVYSYMIDYSVIDNVSMYGYNRHYGDCGVQALLFITLCRISGVPARWQGCWTFFPEGESIHDWAEFYVEPYGWLPCDPYCAIWAKQQITSLNEAEKTFLQDFFFGNMTAYRMVANADHCAELYPRKESFRSDTVDFQLGELEWEGHNIYFNQRSTNWEVKPAN